MIIVVPQKALPKTLKKAICVSRLGLWRRGQRFAWAAIMPEQFCSPYISLILSLFQTPIKSYTPRKTPVKSPARCGGGRYNLRPTPTRTALPLTWISGDEESESDEDYTPRLLDISLLSTTWHIRVQIWWREKMDTEKIIKLSRNTFWAVPAQLSYLTQF